MTSTHSNDCRLDAIPFDLTHPLGGTMSDMHCDTEYALTFPCDGRHVLYAYVMRDTSNPRGARLNVCNVCLYSFAQGRDLMKPGSCSMSDIKNAVRSRQVASHCRQDMIVESSHERTPGECRTPRSRASLYAAVCVPYTDGGSHGDAPRSHPRPTPCQTLHWIFQRACAFPCDGRRTPGARNER